MNFGNYNYTAGNSNDLSISEVAESVGKEKSFIEGNG